MHWDRLFEDLEGQLAAEWESERAALDAESERLRIAKLPLRRRMRTLADAQVHVTLTIRGGSEAGGALREVGADWAAVAGRATQIVPLDAITAVRVDHGALLGSLERSEDQASLQDRMTFGFVLRDLARRRAAVWVETTEGVRVHGTVDRAGADHLDLAEHEPGASRRAVDVSGFRIVPFAAVARIEVAPG